MEFPEQCGSVLHQDDIGETGQDGTMCERRGSSSVGDDLHCHRTIADEVQHVLGGLYVHVVLEDLPICLFDYWHIVHTAQRLQKVAGSDLLPVDGDGAAHVVPQDHEAPGSGVSEPEFEYLGILDGLPKDLFQLGRLDESGNLEDVELPGTTQHETVVGYGYGHIGSYYKCYWDES